MNLNYEKRDVYTTLSQIEIDKANQFAKNYIEFLNKVKTEYLCVEVIVDMLNKAGFLDITKSDNLKPNDKVYFINKEKSLFIAVIGSDNLINGVNIVGSHIDSPRLDLKPQPLFESQDIAMFKTQYYGGIKKYQWLAIPLAMYGVIYNENGEKVCISIGDNENDPCFTIADLLPHLAKDQMKLNANEFIDPEKMSIIAGNTKNKEVKEKQVKTTVLKILNEKYNIKEIDFARSEISFVPAFNARFVGLDTSMVGGYGQDDRVCTYANIMALLDTITEQKDIKKTMIAMVVDKEEIGSIGNTSMNSQTFDMFINKILEKTQNTNLDKLEVYYNSCMLSADVSTAIDPDYEEVSDIQNGNILGCGISIEKYTGGSGKSSASDANAKYVAKVMSIFEKNNIVYQIGTLGKMGKGGGGTIAYILANKGVEVIDCGTPILAMHSPFEVSSVYDIYMTYLGYKSFFKN
ncbi:MAG: aminopeptidase [Clostridia bacterium]